MSENQPVPHLSVHKNTRDERRARNVSRSLVDDAKSASRHKDIRGYVIVAWDKEWATEAQWNVSDTIPSVVVPEFVKQSILRHMGINDARKLYGE